MTTATFSLQGGDPISDKLNAMLDNVRGTGLQSYLATTVFKQYQQFQLARWQSAGSGDSSVTTSEGDRWEALNKKYLKRKRKKYATFDYGGNQMLVAKGDLLKSVIGPGNGQQILTTQTGMTITTTLYYAKFVSKLRYFESLGESSMGEIRQGIMDYVMGG